MNDTLVLCVHHFGELKTVVENGQKKGVHIPTEIKIAKAGPLLTTLWPLLLPHSRWKGITPTIRLSLTSYSPQTLNKRPICIPNSRSTRKRKT